MGREVTLFKWPCIEVAPYVPKIFFKGHTMRIHVDEHEATLGGDTGFRQSKVLIVDSREIPPARHPL